MSLREQQGTYFATAFTDIYLYKYFDKFKGYLSQCRYCNRDVYSHSWYATTCLQCATTRALVAFINCNIFFIKLAWQPQPCCVCDNPNGTYYLAISNEFPWWHPNENHFCTIDCIDDYFINYKNSDVVHCGHGKIQINPVA